MIIRPLNSDQPNLERSRWLTAYAPLFIWIVVILGLGSGIGASSETSRFIRPLLEFLFPDALPQTLSVYHGYIRKFAHFAEYAILGWLACRAFVPRESGFEKRTVLWAAMLVVIVAVIDETTQSFNPNRTGSIYDVAIDLAGGFCAIALFSLNAKSKARHSSY